MRVEWRWPDGKSSSNLSIQLQLVWERAEKTLSLRDKWTRGRFFMSYSGFPPVNAAAMPGNEQGRLAPEAASTTVRVRLIRSIPLGEIQENTSLYGWLSLGE